METVIHNTVHVLLALGLPPLLLGVIAKTKAAVRRPGRAAGVAAVLRPDQALPKGLGLQHHDDLGVPGRAGGRAGDGGDRGAAGPADGLRRRRSRSRAT